MASELWGMVSRGSSASCNLPSALFHGNTCFLPRDLTDFPPSPVALKTPSNLNFLKFESSQCCKRTLPKPLMVWNCSPKPAGTSEPSQKCHSWERRTALGTLGSPWIICSLPNGSWQVAPEPVFYFISPLPGLLGSLLCQETQLCTFPSISCCPSASLPARGYQQ